MNVDSCEDNAGRSKKMRYNRRKNKGGGGGLEGGPPAPSLDPPLDLM